MLAAAGLLVALALHAGADAFNAPGLTRIDPYTLKAPQNLLSDQPAINEDGTINVVVEIPTGTTAKWEVVKPSGVLKWEFKNGEPRVVRYLGYPENYGMIPSTLLPKALGGDGDPLDVILLGPAVPRGTVVRARVIGVLGLLDGGEQDDKILAVIEGDALARATSVAELDDEFPGVTTIIETWFVSYKGPGELESKGFAERDEAMKTVEAAASAFRRP